MSNVARVAVLVSFWLLAWGDASIANVLTGSLLAVALIVAFPSGGRSPDAPRVRPLGTLRLVLYLLGQLVPSNVLVAREILSRRSHIRTGVLAYPIEHASDEVLTLMAHVLALTPGTMPVEVTREPPVIYVHFLLLHDVERARRTLAHLEDLCVAALGGPAIAASDDSIAPGVES